MIDYERTPRERRLDNEGRRGRAVTRGGAARLRLLAELEARRWRDLPTGPAPPSRPPRPGRGR